jgi:hypothetical protein
VDAILYIDNDTYLSSFYPLTIPPQPPEWLKNKYQCTFEAEMQHAAMADFEYKYTHHLPSFFYGSIENVPNKFHGGRTNGDDTFYQSDRLYMIYEHEVSYRIHI